MAFIKDNISAQGVMAELKELTPAPTKSLKPSSTKEQGIWIAGMKN
jgi:hypothetical protein